MPEPSGSPIIIDGGNSVKIKFKHDAYVQPGDGDEHVHNVDTTKIAKIELTGSVNQTFDINGSGQKVKITLQ